MRIATSVKTALIAFIVTGLVGITAHAAEKKEAVETAVAAASAYTLEYGKEAVVRGVIEKTESGIFLLDGKGTFLLKGEDDLEKLVGQPVEVTGMLKKGDKNNILRVDRVKVVE